MVVVVLSTYSAEHPTVCRTAPNKEFSSPSVDSAEVETCCGSKHNMLNPKDDYLSGGLSEPSIDI